MRDNSFFTIGLSANLSSKTVALDPYHTLYTVGYSVYRHTHITTLEEVISQAVDGYRIVTQICSYGINKLLQYVSGKTLDYILNIYKVGCWLHSMLYPCPDTCRMDVGVRVSIYDSDGCSPCQRNDLSKAPAVLQTKFLLQ